MAQPYVGEIRMFAGNFPPAGWMFCEGQFLPISEYEVLFQLLGTTYGGDGESTFQLPDLCGRIPLHSGNGFILGEKGGVEDVTLTVPQIPTHNHLFVASTTLAGESSAADNVVAQSSAGGSFLYFPTPGASPLSTASVGVTGGSQPHTNFQPYLCVDFIISLFGVYPSP